MTANARSVFRTMMLALSISAFPCCGVTAQKGPQAKTQNPVITSFSPASGPVGTTVMIEGGPFARVDRVTFGGAAASFSKAGATEIIAVVPDGAVSGLIAVDTNKGTAVSPDGFLVTTPATPPAVTSFSPVSGFPGDAVRIFGSNLMNVSSVAFHGTPAHFIPVSDSEVDATVPEGATTGAISVSTPDGVAVSSAPFSVDHYVDLQWSPSSASGVSYNLYRAASSSGPWTRINPSPIAGTSYRDLDVISGATYFYECKAVNSAGNESGPSNVASAAVP